MLLDNHLEMCDQCFHEHQQKDVETASGAGLDKLAAEIGLLRISKVIHERETDVNLRERIKLYSITRPK